MVSTQKSAATYKKMQTGVLNNTDKLPRNSDEHLLPENLKLESTEVDLAAIRQIDGYKDVRYKDALYIGTVINGKRHGKGVMKYRNGR